MIALHIWIRNIKVTTVKLERQELPSESKDVDT
jgi:hypothetical protein